MIPKNTKQWVLWRREEVKKQGIPTGDYTKIPYTPEGKKASSTNKNTWSSYDDVLNIRHKFDGIGFVFDGSWLGIDLDHVLEAGVIQDELSKKFVTESKTLTEISPSGDGLHLYFKLSEPLNLVSHAYKPNEKYKYECYSEKRYFTVTENIYENYRDVRTIDTDEALELLKILGYPWKRKKPTTTPPTTNHIKNKYTDQQILQLLFTGRNGSKMKRVYEGTDIDYEDDTSTADAALCSMLAFYTNKDREKIERIWLASPRGSREKTQKRADYRKLTIDFAIEKTEETFGENLDDQEEYEYYVTQEGRKGEVIVPIIIENIRYFLNTHRDFKGRFRFEEFKQIIEHKQGDTWKRLRDEDIIFITNAIARAHPYFARVKKDMVLDAVLACAKQYAYDEVLQYFTNLKWDKKPRLDHWLAEVFGVEADAYHRAVGGNWLKGLVKRAVEPGCKFDYVIVIEGKQGIKKSTALSMLADPWHTETVATPDNKDFFLGFVGNLVVEFAEGETLSRGEMKKLKAVITMTHDDLRLPYARMMNRYPRRCVFAMTTNEDQYLKDNTGNRRWLPARAVFDEANVDWLEANKDQLFAEAFERVITNKEAYWEFPKEETESQQKLRVLTDPNEDLILDWYTSLDDEKRNAGITTREAFEAVNPLTPNKPMNKSDQMAMAAILKNKLFLIGKYKMVNGVSKNVFVPTNKTPYVSVEERNPAVAAF